MNYKRSAAFLLGVLLLSVMLLSAAFLAAEADHDCTGEDCPVCACMQLCERTLHNLSDGAALQAAVVVSVIFALVSGSLPFPGFSRETPVSRKIRLNN